MKTKRNWRSKLLLAASLFLATSTSGARAQELTDDQLGAVKNRLAEGATHR